MAREKVLHAKAMGAEVVITRSDVGKGHPDYYQDLAQSIAQRTPNAVFINQFANPANPLAHETTTGPEILRQMEGKLDAVVVGVGSGGTLTGVGRFLRQASPQTQMILADPQGSVLAPLVETGTMGQAGSWAVEGIGEDFVPPNADLSLVHEAFSIPDAESFATARELLLRKGSLPALHPARCSRQRSDTLGRSRCPSAWSRSSVIPARNISPRCSIPRFWRRKVGPIRTGAAPCAMSS
jgi:cystathionine beta-synthase